MSAGGVATMATMHGLLELMIERAASDLILTEGRPPLLRTVGELRPIEAPALTEAEIDACVGALLTPEQREEFARTNELDASHGLPGRARFRINVFRQRGTTAVAIRMLPHEIPVLDALGVPEIVKRWLLAPHGIIITTGPTGSGKSTSQAAMIRFLNERKPYHIVTIEDPIEYVHAHGECTIEQRELGRDTQSFPEALRRVFRQSPDVIMIGEMRDQETFETALQLAETGHLVLATLHTGDTTQAISRIIDVFPPDQHQQIRMQLSLTLIGVLAQELVPRVDGDGRVLAVEVLEATPAVRNLIRKNDLQQLYSVIQTSTADGMRSMNASLLEHFRAGRIALEEAMLYTTRQRELEQLIARDAQVSLAGAARPTRAPAGNGR